MTNATKGYATVLFTRKDEHGAQILLQKKDRGYRSYPDHWTVFGGNIEEHETELECLVREIKEELGLDYNADDFSLFKRITIKKNEEDIPLALYIAEFAGKISEISLGEGCGFAFWYSDEVSNLQLIPHEIDLINEVISDTNLQNRSEN